MPLQVKKAKTAFLYYQGAMLGKIRDELGAEATMGLAMNELSRRWRAMSSSDKQHYFDLETTDRERFERETLEADQDFLAEQERKRQSLEVQDDEAPTSRQARRRVEETRQAKHDAKQARQIKARDNVDPEEKAERNRIKQEQQQEIQERRQLKQAENEALQKKQTKLDKDESKKAAQRLEYLLKQSSIFAKLKGGTHGIDEEYDHEKEEQLKKEAKGKKGKEAHHRHEADSNEEDEEDEVEADRHVFLTKQPNCIEFGQLKPYQVESLNWMIHLAEKGLNGILADEMGLGKTLQSISIMAYHWEYLRIQGPHLVCVPKSTLSNWMNELNRWCPSLRAIKFHGSREEREELIEKHFTIAAATHDGKRPDKQITNEKGQLVDDNSDNPRQWDVCVTTYEVANSERKVFQRFVWRYLIIDEAHRLKNDASMFSSTVRSFRTSNRLLLTGTPLQNNLHELWALLNFMLPDIFTSAEQFDEWFNLEVEDEEAKRNMISQLHKILRPFMLRRLKADVAKGLPPKTETILMVGMSKMQKQLYKKLLLRDLDSITGKGGNKNKTAVLNIVMQLRKCCGHPYLFEGMEDRTLDPLGEHLVENCGKLSMVDKLLKRLKERGSRVLIFTQMTRVLDILDDFMVMRGYQYCRIDGNTDYDDRESAIDDFNKPDSDKFCFILSTRAGGLGINLQTADTCILYDSDWNPQQDLQAQDRCHRLGQKKPVNVFRLVSENTVEEKIVERAQQKLKLDAMVVQQGRLKDKDKVTKDEIMAAVRFGADTVFRSEESTITDEDIDVILERGAAKTKELNEKLQAKDKGDLLDFRLDGGMSAQTFEGIDYSDSQMRDHLRMLAADSMGKRERRPPPVSYNPIIHSKKSMVVNNTRIKLPKCLRVPQMEDHHFYNRERLLELGNLEFETYAALREANKLPPKDVMEEAGTLLPYQLGQEKKELLAEGFGTWSRSQYFHFIKACAKFGRDDISSIAADMDMPEESIAEYSKAFWEYGPTELKSDWERIIGGIERGEKKIAKQKKLKILLSKFVGTFKKPRDELTFSNKGTAHFTLEQDRAFLCAVDKHRYGNWDSVREEVRTDNRLKFQHTVQGMTVQSIAKRCDYRMRQMERELEAREKTLRSKCPPTVLAAQRVVDAIKETDTWDQQCLELQLKGEEGLSLAAVSVDNRFLMSERLKDRNTAIFKLREVEVQVQRALGMANVVRKSIFEHAPNVNYSQITMKAGSPITGRDEDTGQTVQDVVGLEERINKAILKIPPCGLCDSCRYIPMRLCYKRLEERHRIISEETEILRQKMSKNAVKKKVKKRKPEGTVEGGSSVPVKKAKSSTPAVPTFSLTPNTKSDSKPDGSKLTSDASATSTKRRSTEGMTRPTGNRRMAIPDDLFPEFCRRISANGTCERTKLIADFVQENPETSLRQVTMKLADITVKDKPQCITYTNRKSGRGTAVYLRPCFYSYLPVDERPENWEFFAEQDKILWDEEQANKKTNGADNASTKETPSKADTMSIASVDDM